MNKSGWFMLLVLASLWALAWEIIIAGVSPNASAQVWVLVRYFVILLQLYWLYFLGFKKGTVGENDYGAPPSVEHITHNETKE